MLRDDTELFFPMNQGGWSKIGKKYESTHGLLKHALNAMQSSSKPYNFLYDFKWLLKDW